MAYQQPIEKKNGQINEVELGTGSNAVRTGGATTMPFYLFEGDMPHRPAIAMEVFDHVPDGWPAPLTDALGELLSDPVAWAKACVERFGADMVCVQLSGITADGSEVSAESSADLVKAIADAVDVPIAVYGSGNAEKDVDVLKKVAESITDTRLAIGSATEDNYKPITAAALAYGHVVISETPIDVNMAKQLNILMTQMGLPADRILIDPSVGAVGYGIEYAYTVMERLRLAALDQNDEMTQMPMICNLGKEAWRAKEARAPENEEPAWGDASKRGILWEAVTATTLAMAGADILVMRHPDAVALLQKTFADLEV